MGDCFATLAMTCKAVPSDDFASALGLFPVAVIEVFEDNGNVKGVKIHPFA